MAAASLTIRVMGPMDPRYESMRTRAGSTSRTVGFYPTRLAWEAGKSMEPSSRPVQSTSALLRGMEGGTSVLKAANQRPCALAVADQLLLPQGS